MNFTKPSMPNPRQWDSFLLFVLFREAPGLGTMVPGRSQSTGCSDGGIPFPASNLWACFCIASSTTATATATITEAAARRFSGRAYPGGNRRWLPRRKKEETSKSTRISQCQWGDCKEIEARKADICDEGQNRSSRSPGREHDKPRGRDFRGCSYFRGCQPGCGNAGGWLSPLQP